MKLKLERLAGLANTAGARAPRKELKLEWQNQQRQHEITRVQVVVTHAPTAASPSLYALDLDA